jgi:hypothetical protein
MRGLDGREQPSGAFDASRRFAGDLTGRQPNGNGTGPRVNRSLRQRQGLGASAADGRDRPAPSGSEALRQTRRTSPRNSRRLGLTVEEQPFVAQTPIGPINMVNLITRLPGKRTDRILITGHLRHEAH